MISEESLICESAVRTSVGFLLKMEGEQWISDEGKDKMNKPSCSMISAELGSCDFIENKDVLNGNGVMELPPLVERTIN